LQQGGVLAALVTQALVPFLSARASRFSAPAVLVASPCASSQAAVSRRVP